MLRALTLYFCLMLGAATLSPMSAAAQAGDPPSGDESLASEQTVEDIMRRQQGLAEGDINQEQLIGDRAAPQYDTEILDGVNGDPGADLWRAFRFDEDQISTQVRGPATDILIQDRGMWWWQVREGPLIFWGGILLLGTIAALALFYLIKGRVRIDGTKTGRVMLRFTSIERFSHWLLAGSFIVLAITGLLTLMGRKFLIPTFGHEAFALVATGSKWIHNNISWAFMIALVLIFVQWVWSNLPDKTDVNWILKGGGLLTKGHPPAKKFNAGQKLIFWSVIVFGASISASGLALLFPFELQMFAPTFEKINAVGVPGWFGFDPLPTALSPQAEMQYSQLWHAIVGFVLMAIIIAHIYIGSIGMEGAWDAMGKGWVEEQWAREHHSIWAEKKLKKGDVAPKKSGASSATPAE